MHDFLAMGATRLKTGIVLTTDAPIHPASFQGLLSENDLAVVLLEHIDYLLKLQGKASSFGYAAYSLSQLKEPLSSMKSNLRKIRGIGEASEAIILETLRTGSSSYYEDLMS